MSWCKINILNFKTKYWFPAIREVYWPSRGVMQVKNFHNSAARRSGCISFRALPEKRAAWANTGRPAVNTIRSNPILTSPKTHHCQIHNWVYSHLILSVALEKAVTNCFLMNNFIRSCLIFFLQLKKSLILEGNFVLGISLTSRYAELGVQTLRN